MSNVGFTGTVAACFTRHVPQATGVSGWIVAFDANWIVAIDVESADEGSPILANTRDHIFIHSPTQSFFYSAEEIVGMRFRFELQPAPHGKGWWLKGTTRIDV